jgi:hypothetical protein
LHGKYVLNTPQGSGRSGSTLSTMLNMTVDARLAWLLEVTLPLCPPRASTLELCLFEAFVLLCS